MQSEVLQFHVGRERVKGISTLRLAATQLPDNAILEILLILGHWSIKEIYKYSKAYACNIRLYL